MNPSQPLDDTEYQIMINEHLWLCFRFFEVSGSQRVLPDIWETLRYFQGALEVNTIFMLIPLLFSLFIWAEICMQYWSLNSFAFLE